MSRRYTDIVSLPYSHTPRIDRLEDIVYDSLDDVHIRYLELVEKNHKLPDERYKACAEKKITLEVNSSKCTLTDITFRQFQLCCLVSGVSLKRPKKKFNKARKRHLIVLLPEHTVPEGHSGILSGASSLVARFQSRIRSFNYAKLAESISIDYYGRKRTEV